MVIATTFRGARIKFSDHHGDHPALQHHQPGSASERMAVVLAGIHGDQPVSTLCREYGITEFDYLAWR